MDSVLNKKHFYERYQDIIAFLLFAAGVIFLIWKCPIGFSMDDENFYLTIPYRLVKGDSLLTDDWHVSQLSAFLQYIPVKLFLAVKGSTEGIILFFRYLFVAMQAATCCVIYLRMRKYGPLSIFIPLICLLHVPITYMSVNYNSMGLCFVELIGVFLLTTQKFNRFIFYLIGVFVSCSVLCNPFLPLIYFAFTGFMIVYEVKKKKIRKTNSDKTLYKFIHNPELYFSFKSWLFITLGILTVFILFAAFVLSRTSLSEIIANFPMLFTDPEYQFTSDLYGYQNIFSIISTMKMVLERNWIVPLLLVILTVAVIADRKRIEHRRVYLPLGILMYLLLVLLIVFTSTSWTYFIIYTTWMFPLAYLGFICYMVSRNKDKNAFAFLWMYGLFYALIIDITSDCGPATASLGLGVSCIASVLFIRNIVAELKADGTFRNIKVKKLLSGAVLCMLAVQVAFQVFILSDFKLICVEYEYEFEHNPSEKTTEKLDTYIEQGPLKGVRTTATKAGIYNNMIADLDRIKEMSGGTGNILVTENFPWCYLYLEMPFATYSTWVMGDRWFYTDAARLDSYYELHPDKKPDYFYVPNRCYYYYKNNPRRADTIADDIAKKYNCDVIKGREGIIIKVNS